MKAGSAVATVQTYNGRTVELNVTVLKAPTSLAFESKTCTLYPGDTYTPVMKISKGAADSYSLSSANAAVVAVMDDGRSLRATGPGTVKITAKTYNGLKATLTVTVPAPPESIRLEPASVSLCVGKTQALKAVMPAGQGDKLSYSSSDADVAEVDDGGKVTAKRAGSAEITVRTRNGLSAACAVNVYDAPTAMALSPDAAEVGIRARQLQLEVRYATASEGGSCTFSTSDKKIATVDASGLVHFVKPGKVKITARSWNGLSATCALTIFDQPEKITFAQAAYEIALGDEIEIAPTYDKCWESYVLRADNPCVTIDGDRVRGAAEGTATLTAESEGGLRASCEVRVLAAPTGIELTPAEAELAVGRKLQLSAKPLPHGVGTVRFESDDAKVAAVDASGLVTAVAAGTCRITATTYDGKQSASCEVTVSMLPLSGLRIGVDPGHQGKGNSAKEASSPSGGEMKAKVSSGTTGVNTRIPEHRTNLAIGLKLRDALKALGAEVVMTREVEDIDISNQQRAFLMNEKQVDLALRLHCNGSTNHSAYGMDVYTRGTCAYGSSEVNAKELLANEKRAAEAIFNELSAMDGARKRGIHYNNNYTMNNWAKVPCLLVEMGFLTNPEEDAKLNDPAYQDLIVKGLINGICVYAGREKIY